MMSKLSNALKKFILYLLFRGSDGESIFNRKWDNLIILDACRYDTFIEVIKELKVDERHLDYIISLGSDTTEFLLRNFTAPKYDDVVYVTANPFVNIILKDKVYKIVPVWDHGWDPDYGTVPPLQVYYHALKAYLRYPNKRLIIHFIQPHYPYLTHLYEPMKAALNELRKEALSDHTRKDFSLPLKLKRVIRVLREGKIYHASFYIDFDENTHKKAYRDNLKIVMPYALKLAKILPGVNVITADHGEAFGEKLHPLIPIRVYGHLPEIHIPALVKVPWFTIENSIPKEEARRIIAREIASVERELIRLRVTRALRKRRIGEK